MSSKSKQTVSKIKSRRLKDGDLRLMISNFLSSREEILNKLRETPVDVILQVGLDKQAVEAHKEILKKEISYFEAMFSGSFQESSQQAIDLPHIDNAVVVKNIVTLFYKGTVTVSKEDVQDFYVLCDLWTLDSLKEKCSEFLIQELNCYNCIELECLGQMHCDQSLATASRELIAREFQIISQLDSFPDIPIQVLISILSRDDLNVGDEGEDVILNAAVQWLRYDWPGRQYHMKEILNCVRTTLCSQQCLESLNKLDPAFTVDKTSVSQEIARKRKEILAVFCGYSHTRTGQMSPRLKTVELFDLSASRTTLTLELPVAPSYSIPLNILGRLIYFVIRAEHDAATGKVKHDHFVYTLTINNKFVECAEMFSSEVANCLVQCLTSKGRVALCPESLRLYTVSTDEVNCIRITCVNGHISAFNVEALPSLKPFLKGDNYAGMRVVCLNQRLYVLGGNSGPQMQPFFSKDVLMLHEDHIGWQRMADMNYHRTEFDVVCFENKLIVSGGYGGKTTLRRLQNCECYDPVDNTWTVMASMNQSKSHHCLVVANGQLYAIAGKTYSSQKLSNASEWLPGGARIVSSLIEKYDGDKQQWERMGRLNKGRCMFSAIAFFRPCTWH